MPRWVLLVVMLLFCELLESVRTLSCQKFSETRQSICVVLEWNIYCSNWVDMSARRPGAVGTVCNLARFLLICGVAWIVHYWKQMIKLAVAWRKKLPDDKRKKLIVISGCDRGLGRLLAEQLQESTEEYLVLALTLTKESAAELKASSNESLFVIQCDVTSDKDVETMKDYAESILESKKAVLYTIVNNAGIANPGDFAWFPDIEIFKRVLDVNLLGQLRVTQALLPLMLRTSRTLQEGARILNLSSVCGVTASPSNSSYNASKFAVEAWSDSIRLELQPFNISVVKVRPGQIGTLIQKDWAVNLLKNYAQAPRQIRELYGEDEFSNKVASAFQTLAASSNMTEPMLVVDSLMDMISMRQSALRQYYWIGRDAHTLFRALHSLPTAVADTLKKRKLYFAPVQQSLPPAGVISHVTIRVRSIEKALSFYKAFGLKPIGKTVNGQQFLASGASESKWPTMVLLLEDPSMPARGSWSDVGMTRLCIYSKNIIAEVERLSNLGLEPMAPLTVSKNGEKIAAYKDPDNFVVDLIEMTGVIGFVVRYSLGLTKQEEPCLFHWTINVQNAKHALAVFDGLGFITLSDQNRDQVLNDLLPAFNMDPDSTVIDRIRLCQKPGDHFVLTLMEWIEPRSAKHGAELLNSMTISVTDVETALKQARGAGMMTKPAVYRKMPVFGEVLVGTAFLEENSNCIEFCCFANKK